MGSDKVESSHDVLRRAGDASVLILTSLADGPKHGYALIQDIKGFSGLSLGPGTLYGVLARLEEEGMVELLPAVGHRRPYRITAQGATVLRERLETNVKVAAIGFGRLGTLGA